MKNAAGDYEHTPAQQGNAPVAMANTPKGPGGSPKLTVAQPGEHANLPQAASKSGASSLHEPPVPPAHHAPDPAFETKVKTALQKIPETTFDEYLEKPIERGQVKGRVLMDEVKKVDPNLHDNIKTAVESLHNRKIWETVIRRIQMERTRVAQGQSTSTTYRQSLAAMDSQGLGDPRLARSIELERPGSHSSEAVWNLAEQSHGSTPKMVVRPGDFHAAPDVDSKAPFKGSFYDVNISGAGAVEEKPSLANEPTHGVSHHMIQDLVITEGFQQAGKTGYTAESLRNDMNTAGDKLKAASGRFDRSDLWNFTQDSLETHGQMTAPENVNPIVNSIFPDMR